MITDSKIQVAFATKDDEYIYYIYVTILSILSNSQSNTSYNFHILVPSEFSEKSKSRIQKLSENYHNCSFNFINMKECFKNIKMTHNHIMYPTYYRLLLADVLPEVDKCIYLDSDIIVKQDLSNFYNIDITDFYLAGVRAAGYQINASDNIKRLELPDVDNYINAGVLLINLKKLRADKLTQKFIKLIEKKYHDQDQDIINVACYKKIKTLPLAYNVMTKYEKIFDQCIKANAYTQPEINDAINNPLIIHYADKIKPWQNPEIMFGNMWWQYARQTPFYENILFNNLKNNQELQKTTNDSKKAPVIYKKDATYYRYKILSKITIGHKRKKYIAKFKELKQNIKKQTHHPKQHFQMMKGLKKRFICLIEKHKFSRSLLEAILFFSFLLKKKPKEHLSAIKKIKFITCRYPVRSAGGGQGAALTMNETVLDKEYKGIPVEFIFEKENKYSQKKYMGAYFLYAGFTFALKETKKDKNTVYITHEEETAFGLWLAGKRYIIFSHLQGARLEEKLNNGEKISYITRKIIKFAEKMAFKHALYVCFPSLGAYNYYINSPYRGANKNDFRLGPVIYNTLYLNHTPEVHPIVKKDPSCLTILSIGGFTIAKGIDRSIDLVEEILKQTNKKIRYIIIGKGILQQEIEQKCLKLTHKYNNFSYIIINRCTVGEMPYIQQISDVYIMLHRISIFDLATLEMMNYSKTVVLSNIGGNPEFNKENNIILWKGNNKTTAKTILNTNLEKKGKLNKQIYDKYFSHTSYKKQYSKLIDLLIKGE